MSAEPKSKHKSRLIVASLVATLYLGAMLAAATVENSHPAPHQSGTTHPPLIANSRPMKRLPHPGPWMIRMTGWVVSMVAQFS
jgi:hypothetical protein